MAKKHLVKCRYCNEQFDANTVEYALPQKGWYYHAQCYKNYSSAETNEQKEIDDFYRYLRQLDPENFVFTIARKLTERYIKENQFTYRGMLNALMWYYEIEKQPIKKGSNLVALIPYIYNKAKLYYEQIEKAHLKVQTSYTKEEVNEYTLETPTVQNVKTIKLFNLED